MGGPRGRVERSRRRRWPHRARPPVAGGRARLRPRSAGRLLLSPDDVRNALDVLKQADLEDDELAEQWRDVLQSAADNKKGLYVTFYRALGNCRLELAVTCIDSSGGGKRSRV